MTNNAPSEKLDLKNQKMLIRELQDGDAKMFENLAAALIGRLLNVHVSVAKSGFQHGGDAGPAGDQGRRFRLECKKYSSTTYLKDRELLGEIDHALARDEALEGWFLVATRSVPEQLAQDLVQKGEKLGIPVVILDWKEHEITSLAALCSFDPDLVESEFSRKAATFARALQVTSTDAVEMLRRNLQSWCLGFESLRDRSHKKLDSIWSSPRASNAELGQDVAGAAQDKRIKRSAVHQALSTWWHGPARSDSPAAVIGWDGVGKTWAVLDWLIETKGEQPVILIIPSSAAANLSTVSETNVKQFVADRLYEVSGVRDSQHWLRRLDYLLKRPSDEGPVLTLFFDGLNQESSVPWLSLLKVLQGETFAGRVRVVISSRNHYFDNKLSRLRGLVVAAVPITVDLYDTAPGGELDQMLAFESLTQADLHPDLIELARTPRLFKLVVRFRENLVKAGQITLHRLLWEYGRDSFGVRAGKSFSESEWKAWLKEIAQKYRDGVEAFSVKSLGETVNRPDLSETEVYSRLSDIIDGRFAKPEPSGCLQLAPAVIAHALGVAVLAQLDAVVTPTFESLDAELTLWLDPIAGFDQRAEILRAAVSIMVERGDSGKSPITGVLVTAWLQSQNVGDNHRRELANLALYLTGALLDAVEHSDNYTHASARLWAVNALRAIPRKGVAALTTIVERIRKWFSIISREIDSHPDSKKSLSDRFIQRIGIDTSGPVTVIGVDLELVDQFDISLRSVAPSIIEGFPLAQVVPIMEVAAISLAIKGREEGWDGLKWLCFLNEVDPDDTVEVLRALSKDVRFRTPEPGVHADLPARTAAILLWLSGQEIDEDTAVSIDPGIDRWWTYEKDYLPQPGRSFFPLERRHAEIVLHDTELPLLTRIQRTKELWLDPNFEPPDAFVDEVRAAIPHLDVEKLDRHMSHTIEDHNFEELEPVFARCAPQQLADLIHNKMQNMATCPPESRYWNAVSVTDHFLLAGESEAVAAKTLRMSNTDEDEGREFYAASQLLILELQNLDAQAQIDRLIQSNLKSILTDLAEVLRVPTSHDVDALISRYAPSSAKEQDDLITLLSIHRVEFSDSAWSWLEGFAKQTDYDHRGLVFQMLTRADAERFGRRLVADGWSWRPEADVWINHYGTGAYIEATRALPFEQIIQRLAPWRILEAARLRGSDRMEVRLAAEIFSHVLMIEKVEEPDPGSNLSVDRADVESPPFSFSVSPRTSEDDANNPMEALSKAMDAKAQEKAYRRAAETAISRIRELHASGASLYLAKIDTADYEQVLEHTPDMVDLWIEGYQEISTNFRHRVRLAEGAFLTLCEALLAYDPVRGTQFWRAVRASVVTRYMGVAGVEELLHMVFRVPDSPEVNELRNELTRWVYSNTDRDLFNLATAASYNGKADWLARIIETDRASPLAWKRKRGVVFAGFTTNNTLPVADAWPEGEIRTGYAALECKSARFRWAEACAHHWWCVYLKAQDLVEAYAAWVLFLRSADQRAWIWINQDWQAENENSSFMQLKLSHARLNRSARKRAMEKRVGKLDENYVGRKILAGVGPWS